MKNKYLVILLFFLTSCITTTNYIPIDILNPAMVSIPDSITSIVIVNNAAVHIEDGVDAKDMNEVLTDSMKSIIPTSLCKFMTEEGFYSKVVVHPEVIDNQNADPLSRQTIIDICRQQNANALISLDIIYFEDEKVNNNRMLYGRMIVAAKLYSQSGDLIRDSIVSEQMLYKDLEYKRAKNFVEPLVSELSVLSADKLTSFLIPSWTQQERWLYYDSSSQMKVARKHVDENDWDSAIIIWIQMFDEEENISKKIRLASNIAVANEFLDNVEDAYEWINFAAEMATNDLNKVLVFDLREYKNILEKRYDNIQKLNLQLR